MGLPRRNNGRPTHMTSGPAQEPAMNPFSMDDNVEDDDLINDGEMYDDEYEPADSAEDMMDKVDSINEDQPFDDGQSSYLDDGPEDYDLHEPEPTQPQVRVDKKKPEFTRSTIKPEPPITEKDVKPSNESSKTGTPTATIVGLVTSIASFIIFVPMLGAILSVLQGSTTPLVIAGITIIILPFVGLAAGAMSLSHKGGHKGPAIASIIMSLVAIITVGIIAMQMNTVQVKVVDSVNSAFSQIMNSSAGQSGLQTPEDSDSRYGDGVYGGTDGKTNRRDEGKSSSSESKSNESKSSNDTKKSKTSGLDNDGVHAEIVDPSSVNS